MATRSCFMKPIWFLRGIQTIKYLEDNNAPIWRPDAFSGQSSQGCKKEGIFPENIEKVLSDGTKQWKYGREYKARS